MHGSLRNRDGNHLVADQRHAARSAFGQDAHVDLWRKGLGEGQDVLVGGHVVNAQVLAAVADVHVALGFDPIRVGAAVECSEFADVVFAHVDALHQGVTADDAGVQGGQQIDGLLELLPRTAVPLWPADVVEDLLVGRVHGDVELCGQGVEVLQHLRQGAVGDQHRRHAVLVAEVHVLGQTGVEGRFAVEGNGDVLGVLRFCELLWVHLVVAAKAGQKPALCTDGFVQQFQRVLVRQLQRVHVRFTPAVGAGQVALVDHGRHLHAGVALDAVEGALVARAVAQKGLLGPVAGLHAAVLPHDVVALLLQGCFQCWIHAHGLRLPECQAHGRHGRLGRTRAD